MTDLITRLSKLAAPDREVDARIWCEVHGVVYVDHYALMHETQVFFKEKGKRKEQVSGDDMTHAAFYTSSVDAAIALAERVLPGYQWSAGFSRHVPHNAQIWALSGNGYYEGESDANRAIALCIAILRAKEASKL